MQISTKEALVLYEQLSSLTGAGLTTTLLILSSCIFTYIFIFPLTSASKPTRRTIPPLPVPSFSRFTSLNRRILCNLLRPPPRNPVLERVTPEITLCIMKNLPTFSALNALIRASKPCHDIWLENEYGISEAIARNEFGEFWTEATKLLILQAKLKHTSETHEGSTRFFGKIEEGKLRRGIKPVISKVGMGLVLRGQGEMTAKSPQAVSSDKIGILSGGVKIGKEEAAQLLCYKRKVADTRNVFIKTVLRARSYGAAPRSLRFKTIHPAADVIHRIDRAIYNYWLVLLACTPDFITCLAMFEHHNLNDSLSAFLDSQDALSDEEWGASIDREYENVKAYLDFEGRKGELEELCEVTYFTHCLVELPGIGGGHYFGEWGKEEDEGLQGWAGNQIRRAAREGGVDAGGYRIAE